MSKDLYAGLDLGTSGVRLCVIDQQKNIVAEMCVDYDDTLDHQSRQMWWRATCDLIGQLSKKVRQNIKAFAIDGTSGSLLLVNRKTGEPISQPLLYNDHDPEFCLDDKDLSGLSDTFIRALRLLDNNYTDVLIVTQADYLKGKLTGNYATSDFNNSFKLGYDSVAGRWSPWMQAYGVTIHMLPNVFSSGTLLDHVSRSQAKSLGLNEDLRLVAGTTDSVAAVIATEVSETGSAITSLGSTLVLKVLSDCPVTASEYGVYSQPFYDKWLVGGASNCGGQILRQYFDDQTMQRLSKQMTINIPTGLTYYPLVSQGERFPINDVHKKPLLEPRPENDVDFFQAILESLTRIEKKGYELLMKLGAAEIEHIISVGGGSHNEQWMKLRARAIGVPVSRARYSEAAFGSALLALSGISNDR